MRRTPQAAKGKQRKENGQAYHGRGMAKVLISMAMESPEKPRIRRTTISSIRVESESGRRLLRITTTIGRRKHHVVTLSFLTFGWKQFHAYSALRQESTDEVLNLHAAGFWDRNFMIP